MPKTKTNPKPKKTHPNSALKGRALLNNPFFNKGTAFTLQERKKFALEGLLPAKIETLKEQAARVYEQYKNQATGLKKNIFLQELYNTNQTLFYYLVSEHVAEMLPILYTPTVGEAVQTYRYEFRKPYGLYIDYDDRKQIKKLLQNWQTKDVELIVVTDGERILGLGDQGLGGIHIPTAKLMVYTLFGGINPARTLPIVLDVGTNNEKLLNDPLYLGRRKKRVSEKAYHEFINTFVSAVKNTFPKVVLQWEDFAKVHAAENLARFRNKICSFNDDIQGTAVITLAALLVALKISKTNWAGQRIVFYGAGSAGTGIADLIALAMQEEGLSKAEIRKRFWLIGSHGLITEKTLNITPEQKTYARNSAETENWQIKDGKFIGLADVVKNVQPTILIGSAAQSSAFSKEIVEDLAKHVSRPIIFPLSNPTSKSEALPKDLLRWTRGKALVATGSPFLPVKIGTKTFSIAQCNNAYAFPGIGLGVLASRAKAISNGMLLAAAKAILKSVATLGEGKEALLPPIDKVAQVARQVALAVALKAQQEGLTDLKKGADLKALIRAKVWQTDI